MIQVRSTWTPVHANSERIGIMRTRHQALPVCIFLLIRVSLGISRMYVLSSAADVKPNYR